MNGTDLVIPDGVTSIGDYAFGGYSGLTSVTIPDSVTSIGSYAFNWCYSLTIYYRGTEAQWNEVATGSNWKPSSTTIVYNYTGE